MNRWWLKILGYSLMGLGSAVTIAVEVVKGKELDLTIAKKISEALAKKV
jgi:hypothetical protein